MTAKTDMPAARCRRRSLPVLGAVLGAASVLMAGCFAEPPKRAFEEFTRLPKREVLVEIGLGAFAIPIPIVIESASDRFEPDNLLQVDFELFAIVDPIDAKQVKRLNRLNTGRIRDKVIRVCRNTPRDDLLDAQLSTLKAHLLDAIKPYLGGEAVRRIGLSRVVLDEL